ncbi:tyrosine--tRNA ligase [Planctomycetales bacterium ZRK34]|nr:tyrosine--tRNA ligase [Planctomycetales bacterium ZRK34]
MASIDEQMQLLSRGAEHVYSQTELAAKLKSGRRLRIKLGMDPTAPDIHLGHTVVLRKMRQFQDLGHVAVLLIGDYTARIGDPTGRDSTRPILDEATITANAETYLAQAGKILDTDPEKLEVVRNSDWLAKLSFADVLRLTGYVTVQQMLHRENFKLRMRNDTEIMVSEFMYPLMQAYDSVVIKADVELGGTDQTFNNLMGRELMAKHQMEKQVVLTMPILVGLDGTEKMSKSKGNYVAVTDDANDMFGKIMSIPDTLMSNYFTLLTDLPTEETAALLEGHPRETKDRLARIIVEQFHDAQAAEAAAGEFKRRFAEKQLPTDMEVHTVEPGDHPLAGLMVKVGFAGSNSEARRLIKGGAVSFGDDKISDPTAHVNVTSDAVVLKVGKRRVCQVQAG